MSKCMVNKSIQSFAGREVTVIGAGVSNSPLIRMLCSAGAHVMLFLHYRRPLTALLLTIPFTLGFTRGSLIISNPFALLSIKKTLELNL
ncbi:hypothetical protein [Paenibacillus aestuarii]|uniref:Uncharacterized protein n=1 Tax=Paenibacillus aestuarii TaxID=516965 RepID=A0ABW0K2U7_9BACL|nr:hypothetical protein [Paenibacillus aestuarii]